MREYSPDSLSPLQRRLLHAVEQRGLRRFVMLIALCSIVMAQALSSSLLVLGGLASRELLIISSVMATVVPAFVGSFVGVVVGQLLLVVGATSAELQRLSTTDPLTGVANRRAFVAESEELHRNAADAVTVAAMIDLDYFKDINDNFGHAEGDLVLVAFAEQLTSTLASATDRFVIGRLGGDEFAVVAVVSDRHAASRLSAELTAQACARTDVVTVTATVGAVTVDDVSIDEALVRADHALYQVKHARPERDRARR